MPRPQPPTPKIPPQPQPQPSPTPKAPNPTPKPTEPKPAAPDEITWKDTTDAGLTDESFKETDFWEHFQGITDLKATKSIMLYIFWPEDDAESEDKKIANQVRRCSLMEEKIFSSEKVRLASVDFHCLKCNVKELSDELKKKYKISLVPKVIFFDVRGKKAWQLTSHSSKPKSVAKKMGEIAKRSAKLLEKMSK